MLRLLRKEKTCDLQRDATDMAGSQARILRASPQGSSVFGVHPVPSAAEQVGNAVMEFPKTDFHVNVHMLGILIRF